MVLVLADRGPTSVVNGLLGYALFAVFLLPVVLAVAVWRAQRAAKRDGAPTTVWATVALVTVRFYGGLLLIVGLSIAFNGSSNTIQHLDDRIELEDGFYDDFDRFQDKQRLTFTVGATQPLKLCPDVKQGRPVPGMPGTEYYPERNCWARRTLDRDVKGVTVGDWSMRKEVVGPSRSVGRTMTALMLVSIAFLGMALFAIERILRQTAARRPFARSNIGWLRVLAAAVAGAGILAPLMHDWYADRLVEQYFGANATRVFIDETTPVGYGPAAAVVLILVLAEIWRFGIRLQDDAEATV